MKNFKKLIFMFGFVIMLFLFASCGDDKVESFKVQYKDNNQKTIYEGEEIDLDWFELVVHFTNGKTKTFQNHDYYLIKNNYPSDGLFDHKDENVDEIIFDLIFEYDKFQSNEVPITVKKDMVREVSILNYGKTEYLYGEKFDVSGYQLFVSYFSKPNELINLTLEMLDIEGDHIAPEDLGTFFVDVWYNGVKANSPIPLFVTKNNQTLTNEDVKPKYLGDKEIIVTEIPNALYRFYPKDGNKEDYQWTNSNVFTSTTPFLDDYKVDVKLIETNYLEESNIITLNLNYSEHQLKPIYISKTERSVTFKKMDGYQVVVVDHRNKPIEDFTITTNNDYVHIENLIPNTEYTFALYDGFGRRMFET